MTEKKTIDAIVVGSGPSGIACALTIARKNNKVLVIERASDFGVKNMFGGAVYLESVKELFPEAFDKMPYDRVIKKHNYVILNGNNSVSVSYENESANSSFTTTRYSFDTFLSESARKEGVYFAPNTLVLDLIKENGKVIGVKTENEEIYSDVVILAEGFNSILAEKIGLKKKTAPKSAILAVKETIKLPASTIETRFNLKDKEGSMYEFFGGLNKEDEETPLAMGFLYTYKGALTVGVGVSMESLKKGKIRPYEYLERLKNHKLVSSLIEGGEVVEYSAHSIPEGGYRELPKLYDDGVLLVGDCANLVDSVHFEGTNLAIKSGILAGETVNLAIEKNDFSKKTLKEYKRKLFKSFVIKDLKTYKNVVHTLFERRKSVFSFYPSVIDEFFEIFTTAKNNGKKDSYRKFIKGFLTSRGLKDIFLDVISFVKCALEAII